MVEREWWFCNKNGILVYDQMCYDCCFIDEIIDCSNVREKPQKKIKYTEVLLGMKRDNEKR